jgi:hypothetical protein
MTHVYIRRAKQHQRGITVKQEKVVVVVAHNLLLSFEIVNDDAQMRKKKNVAEILLIF